VVNKTLSPIEIRTQEERQCRCGSITWQQSGGWNYEYIVTMLLQECIDVFFLECAPLPDTTSEIILSVIGILLQVNGVITAHLRAGALSTSRVIGHGNSAPKLVPKHGFITTRIHDLFMHSYNNGNNMVGGREMHTLST